MLTEQALRERKWGQYPALRRALEDRKLPDHYYGISSISDTMDEYLSRLLEIAALVREYPDQVRATAQELGQSAMYDDLGRLRAALKSAQGVFEHACKQIEAVASNL